MSKFEDGTLKPDVAQRKDDLIEALADLGIRAVCTSMGRSDFKQATMFAQGRAQLKVVNAFRVLLGMRSLPASENTYTITNCDGVIDKSAHQRDEAFDLVLLAKDGKQIWRLKDENGEPIVEYVEMYKTLGVVAKARGFTWGGDFKPIDQVTGIGFDPFHLEI